MGFGEYQNLAISQRGVGGVGSHQFTRFVIITGSPDIGRSNLIGIIRKTRNLFKNLRFCGKRKNRCLQLANILKSLTLKRLQAFISRIVIVKI